MINLLSGRVLFAIYGCSFLSIAYLFLMRNKMLLFRMQQQLPLDFLTRFCIFWLISFIVVFTLFFLHLYLNRLQISRVERVYSYRIGKIVFGLGIFGAIIASAGLYFLQ